MINETIKKRKSVRKYDPEGVVTDAQIKKILEAGMMAPSAVNSRPWEFIVVRNREKLDAVTKYHPFARMLRTAPVAIIVTADPNVLEKCRLTKGTQFWQQDCGASVQNILLQATELGLGTCWCGIYPVEEIVIETQKLFDIPKDIVPFCVIALGVPAEDFGGRGFYEASKVRWVE